MNDLCSQYSNRFKVTIHYYPDSISYYDRGHIGIAWGCSDEDGRGYYLTFIDGVFDDSATEVA